MSTTVKKPARAMVVPAELPIEIRWAEVARAIFAARGIRTGRWHLGLRLEFAALTTQSKSEPGIGYPTGMIAMTNITLSRAKALGPMVFDAAPSTAAPSAEKRTKRPARRAP